MGTISDRNGAFRLKISENFDDYVLYIGKIGYKELLITDLYQACNQAEFILVDDTALHIDFVPKK